MGRTRQPQGCIMQNEAKASRFRGLASPCCIQTVGSLHTPNSGCTGVGPQPLKKKSPPAGSGGQGHPRAPRGQSRGIQGLINQEASPGGCPLLWPNASRSLVTEPRPDISTSRIFQGPSSLQAWEGWESGPQAWHLASVPLCAFATGTADE